MSAAKHISAEAPASKNKSAAGDRPTADNISAPSVVPVATYISISAAREKCI